jgi:4-hydroxy-tetrahydrodipicolinate synthase
MTGRKGVFVPLVTPLDDKGAVCRASVARLLACSRHLASGYMPCLTSGEGWRLSRAQWEDMLRFTISEAKGRPVIVGIERPTTAEVVELAKMAQWFGANGIMMTSPFGAGVDQHLISNHYREVHDACALDIYIYNESALSENETLFETLLEIAELARVVGIKDSVQEGRSAAQIRSLQERGVAYYIGWEQHLASGVPADGCVVSLANVEPALCRAALASTQPAVREEVLRLSDIHALLSEDWYRHLKTALVERGVIATDRTVAI